MSIDVALSGVCAREPELKISANSGKPYCSFTLGVGAGDARQWVRVCCFGETAEKVAAQLKKGQKAYTEGHLDAGIWQPEGRPAQLNLNVAAWRVEMLGQIGRNKPPKQRDERSRASSQRHSQHEPPFDDDPFPAEMTR